MMLKDVLAWAGLIAAVPQRHPIVRIDRRSNDAAHSAVNLETAMFSGSQVILSRVDKLSRLIDKDPSNVSGIVQEAENIRALADAVANRSEKNKSDLRSTIGGVLHRINDVPEDQ